MFSVTLVSQIIECVFHQRRIPHYWRFLQLCQVSICKGVMLKDVCQAGVEKSLLTATLLRSCIRLSFVNTVIKIGHKAICWTSERKLIFVSKKEKNSSADYCCKNLISFDEKKLTHVTDFIAVVFHCSRPIFFLILHLFFYKKIQAKNSSKMAPWILFLLLSWMPTILLAVNDLCNEPSRNI